MAKKVAPKKVAPKKEAPKKAVKVDFDDNQEVVIDFKGKEKTVGGFNAKVLIKKGVAKFIKIAK